MPSSSNSHHTAIGMATEAILGNCFWGIQTDDEHYPIGLHMLYSSGD